MLRTIRKTLTAAALAVAAFVGVAPANAQTAAQIVSYTNGQLPDFGAVSITVDNIRSPIISLTTALSTSGTGTFTYGGGVSTSRPISTSSYVSATTFYGDGSNLTGLTTTPSWYSLTNIPSGVQAISRTGLIADVTQTELFLGINTGNTSNSGNSNVAFGTNALPGLTTGNSNTAVGTGTLNATTSGNYNTAVGSSALTAATGSNGTDNVAVGFMALNSATQAYRSVGVGSLAVALAPNVSNSTCVGYQSCATAGGTGQGKMWNTTALGSQAGGNLADASGNTLLGYQAGVLLTTGSGNIVLGNGVTPSTVPTSATTNYLNIGNTVFGDTTASAAAGGAARIGINTTAPSSSLDVSGGLIVRGNTSGTTAGYTSATIGNLIANITISGTTVPVSITNPDEISIKSFGAKCDGVTDDSAAIQAAINWPTSATITSPKATCKVNKPITVFIAAKNYDWNGATWDMTYLTSSTTTSSSAITFYDQVASSAARGWGENSFNNLFILGYGQTSGLDGIRFSANNFSTRNIKIDGFRRCHEYVADSYIIDHYTSTLNHCDIGIYMDGTWSNYGEKISYFGGAAANGGQGFFMGNGSGAIYLNNMSNDYNHQGDNSVRRQWGEITAGRVIVNGGHWELNAGTLQIAPISVSGASGGASLVMEGSTILFLGNYLTASATSVVDVGPGGTVVMRDPFIHNTRLLGGCFKSGPGLFTAYDTRTYAVSNMGNCVSQGVSSTENLMVDGGFEKGTMPLGDLIWISNDTAPITNQTSGTNIVLNYTSSSVASGTYALKMTKIGGAATTAGIKLAVPIPYPNAMMPGTLQTQKLTTQGGAYFITAQWAKIPYIASNTIPVITSTSTIGAVTVASSTTPVSWTTRTITQIGQTKAPSGMTHLIWDFNFTSLGAGDIDLDNIKIDKL